MKIGKQSVFLILYGLYIFNQVLLESQLVELGNIGTYISYLRYVILLCITLYIFWNRSKISLNRFIWFAIMLVLAVVNIIVFNGGVTILGIILCVFAARGCKLDKVFLATMIAITAGHVLVLLLCFAGVLNDSVGVRYIGFQTGNFFEGTYKRHSLGFLSSNQLPLAFIIIYMFYIIYKKGNLTLSQHIIAMAINFLLFNLGGARIVFGLCIPLAVFTYLFRLWERKPYTIKRRSRMITRAIGFMSYAAPLFICLLSFALALTYRGNSKFYSLLNMISNNRIYFSHESIRHFGLSLFGSGSAAGSHEVFLTVDNGYIILFLQDGLLLGSMVIACWIYMGYIAQKNKNHYLALVVLLLSVENIINSHLINYKMAPMFCMLMNLNDPLLTDKTMQSGEFGRQEI